MEWGEPVEGKDNGFKERNGQPEDYIQKWRMEENRKNREGAVEAVGEGEKKKE